MADEQLTAEQIAEEAKRVADATKLAEEKAAADTKAAEEAAATLKASSQGTTKADNDMIAKLVQERLDTALADIKSKLDGAYKQRDENAAKVLEFEAKEKAANLKRLTEEGKHKEAFDLQLAEERATNAMLIRRNTELSRDVNVREALRGYTFRNDKAAEMASKEITANLVQNEAGQWVHRSGISVKDYCDAFSKDEEQSFLFKAKVNSGAGTSTSTGTPSVNTTPKSLFAMSQADVIKLAEEGKLPKRS